MKTTFLLFLRQLVTAMLAGKDKISWKVALGMVVKCVQLENIRRLLALIYVEIVLLENIKTPVEKPIASPAHRPITVQKVV
jgi:hypothetical protein